MKEKYARNWTFICDPESLPTNWREILNTEQTAWVESPLHNKDVDSEGNLIKPHLHIVMMYKGARSYSHMQTVTNLLDQEAPKVVVATRGMIRFLIHEDNPSKYHYNYEEIICHGGANIEKYFHVSPTAKRREKQKKDQQILMNVITYTIKR